MDGVHAGFARNLACLSRAANHWQTACSQNRTRQRLQLTRPTRQYGSMYLCVCTYIGGMPVLCTDACRGRTGNAVGSPRAPGRPTAPITGSAALSSVFPDFGDFGDSGPALRLSCAPQEWLSDIRISSLQVYGQLMLSSYEAHWPGSPSALLAAGITRSSSCPSW